MLFAGFASIALVASAFINRNLEKPAYQINKQTAALNLSDDFLRYGFAGYKRLIADILWISTLLESDSTHYKNKDLNNWMYLRFNSITNLDPKFLSAYTFGAQYLSIIKDDLQGAAKIFEKGLVRYPDNYSLNFNAAFLYAMELGDYKRGVELYKKIRNYPQAPTFINTLITRLEYQQSGDLESAYSVLLEMLQNAGDDEVLTKKLETDLYAIKAMIDLECLNSSAASKDCNRIDRDGNRYIYRGGRFKTQKPFTPYKLFTRQKKGAN